MEKREGFSGTCIKDTWTKPNGGRTKGGKWGWLWWGEGVVGRRVFRNYYKGHMDKTKGEGGRRGGRGVWLGWDRGIGRKCRQL